MLTSLLPGLREIRAPLASGSLWLVLGWMWISVPPGPPDDVGWPLGPLLAVADVFDVLGGGIVLAFSAYVVGALLDTLWEYPLRHAPLPTRLSNRGRESLDLYLRSEVPALEEKASRAFKLDAHGVTRTLELNGFDFLIPHRSPEDGTLIRQSHMTEPPRMALELEGVKIEMMSNAKELFSYIDRLEAEADFRLAVAFPILAIVSLMASMDSGLWAVLLGPVSLLIVSSFTKRRMAGDALAYELQVGHAHFPAVRRANSRIDELLALNSD